METQDLAQEARVDNNVDIITTPPPENIAVATEPEANSALANAEGHLIAPAAFRSKRMTLNEAQKYEICVYIREEEERLGRPTNKAIAGYIFNRYGIKVDESTVSRLKSQMETRLSREVSNPTSKRYRQVTFPEIERLLAEFVTENKSKTVITDQMLLKRGKDIREMLGISEAQMKFSDGWLNKFKVRHGLKPPLPAKPRGPMPKRPINNISNGTSINNLDNNKINNNSDIPPEQAGHSGAIAVALENEPVDVAIHSPLPASSLGSASTSMDQEDHHLDITMGHLGTDMEVDNNSDTSMTMEQVINQHEQTGSRAMSDAVVDSSGANFPALQMEILANAYASASSASESALAAAEQPLRQQPSRPLTSVEIRSSQKAHESSDILSMTSAAPGLGTNTFTGLGLSSSTPAAVTASATDVATAATAHSSGSENGSTTARSAAPVTAARKSLSLRLQDPIAAAFQPEPSVDFAEAAQCVNTLRIFMQQQGFTGEQLDNLRDIYVTLNSKRK